MNSLIKALKVEQNTASWWDKVSLRIYEWKLSLPGYYRWHDFYWELRSYIIPQHRELTRAVDRRWRDLVSIIPDFLCECIISFVEKEKCFETIVWSEEEEKELRDLYDFAKWRRHEMALACEQATHEWYQASSWAKSKDFRHQVELPPDEAKQERDLLETSWKIGEEYDKVMTNYLVRIIKFRDKLWT